MRTSASFARLGLLALAAAACCGGAQATEAWASTLTAPADTGAAVAGPMMAPGERVHVVLALAPRDKAALDALTAKIAAGEHVRTLSVADFVARHAPAQATVDAVVAHLRNAGFEDIRVAGNRLLVQADGTAAAVKAAFDADLQHFTVDGRDAYANTSAARVPGALAGQVTAVLGLQTVHRASIAARAATSPAANVGHAATDFSTIYDGDGVPAATKATIGIIAQGSLTPAITDLQTFVTRAGFAMPTTHVIVADTASSDTSNTIEWDIDSQSSLATAGGAIKAINFYTASTLDDGPLTAAYNAAVEDGTAQVINVSLQSCETTEQQSGAAAAQDVIFETAMAQGQTFSIASGDRGSYQCGSKLGGPSWPSPSPYVMSIGGTTLSTTGTTTYAGETLWSCKSALACEFSGGAGGGPSTFEPAPAWQVKAGVVAAGGLRSQPDVSFDADPSTGLNVVVGNGTSLYGGTSLASPIFVGFWARLQSQNNLTLGFPAPLLYKYAGPKGSLFLHDVTSGSNGGYTATTGYDAASGYGSMDIGAVATLIKSAKGH